MKNIWVELKSDFTSNPEDTLFIIESDIPFYNISTSELMSIRDTLTFVLNNINQRIEKELNPDK